LPSEAVVAGQTLPVAGGTVMLLQRVAHETVLRIAAAASGSSRQQPRE